MKMDERVYDDLDALSHAALEDLLSIARDAVRQRGRFAIALSGGRTPAKLYSLWAQAAGVPWDCVHLFWGDERYVEHDDLLSNYRMTQESLLAHIVIPEENVHPMPTNCTQPDDCAGVYELELRKFFGANPPAFDLQLLGVGREGHTASLFPGSLALDEQTRWVAAVEVPARPHQRVTLTPAVLKHGRNTWFLVSGADKREIIEALRRENDPGSSRYPAARLQPAGRVVWYLDRSAAG
jgi:6-phosphogluconolactonase